MKLEIETDIRGFSDGILRELVNTPGEVTVRFRSNGNGCKISILDYQSLDGRANDAPNGSSDT